MLKIYYFLFFIFDRSWKFLAAKYKIPPISSFFGKRLALNTFFEFTGTLLFDEKIHFEHWLKFKLILLKFFKSGWCPILGLSKGMVSSSRWSNLGSIFKKGKLFYLPLQSEDKRKLKPFNPEPYLKYSSSWARIAELTTLSSPGSHQPINHTSYYKVSYINLFARLKHSPYLSDKIHLYFTSNFYSTHDHNCTKLL